MTTLMGSRASFLMLSACVLALACGTPEKKDTQEPAYNVVKEKAAPTSVNVSIAQMKFIPDDVHVHAGDTVIFTNNDVVDHDATSLPDSAWTSGLLHPGDSWKWVADSTAYYFCSIHVVMRGTVTVDP